MPNNTKQKRKVPLRKRSEEITTLHFLTEDDPGETADDTGMEPEGSGMLLEKEDVQLIYQALKAYKPTKDEEVLHSTLLEEFEETLVVEYGEELPDVM
jgi:hypothetical protein